MPVTLKLHTSTSDLTAPDGLLSAMGAALKDLARNSASIPPPLPVVVPSAAFGDWLQVQITRSQGLSMGCAFLRPQQFIHRLLEAAAGREEIKKALGAWSKDALVWRVFERIDAYAPRLGVRTGETFSTRDRFALASLVADRLDQYAHFRPEWFQDGGNLPGGLPESEAWQFELWRELASGMPPHPAVQLRALGGLSVPPPGLGFVFIVSIGLIDPLLVCALDKLASAPGSHVEVHALLPSLGYLADLNRKDAWEVLRTDPAAEPPLDGTHPLVASLGRESVGTFLLLEELDPDYNAWPEPATVGTPCGDGTLLEQLQANLRNLTPPSPADRTEAPAGDTSLRIHACHSPRRELEVLRDELFRAFDEIEDLKPEDVLIAVPDLTAYAPLVEGVLQHGSKRLPVRLTEIPAREGNPVAVALLGLLDMAVGGRMAASEVLDLVNFPAVLANLGVDDDPGTPEQLLNAIRASGLTHGLDPEDRHAGTTQPNENAENDAETGTWRSALDRHLAGFWFGRDEQATDAEGACVFPIASELKNGDDHIQAFITWLTKLALHLKAWKHETTPAGWSKRLTQALTELLASDAQNDAFAKVSTHVTELGKVTSTATLDVGAVRDWLAGHFEEAPARRTTASGEILFGRLKQLHGLPCKVLAVLGLQEGAFPRQSRAPAWDLLPRQPRRWDRDPRAEDRQLFLDALLTPSHRLILSASNRSRHSAHDAPFSSCVEELLRAAEATFRPPAASKAPTVRSHLVIQHHIQPFAQPYFLTAANATQPTVPKSYDARSAEIAAALVKNTSREIVPFYKRPEQEPMPVEGATPVFSNAAPGAVLETLTLDELARFWKDPAKAWLRAIKVALPRDEEDDDALDHAPLSLNELQKWQVKDALLNSRAAAHDGSRTSSRLKADRKLPPSILGDYLRQEAESLVEPIVARLGKFTACDPVDISLQVGGFTLIGKLRVVERDGKRGLLAYRAGKVEKARHFLTAWIYTLAANAQGLGLPCYVLGEGDRYTCNFCERDAIPQDEARAQLETLLRLVCEGRRRPLCFAQETSEALVLALLKNPDDEKTAILAARKKWDGGYDKDQCEGLKPATLCIWRDGDAFGDDLEDERERQLARKPWIDLARAVAEPLCRWATPDEYGKAAAAGAKSADTVAAGAPALAN